MGKKFEKIEKPEKTEKKGKVEKTEKVEQVEKVNKKNKQEKETKNKVNKTESSKPEKANIKAEKQTNKETAESKPKTKKNKSEKEVTEKMEVEEETKVEENVINDTEETATLEDMKKKYETTLVEVREKLSSSLDEALVKKAIKCLKTIIMDKYKNSLNILQNEQEEFLYLNFVLGRLPFKYSMRPMSIAVPNSLYGEKFNTRVCLFVKDPRSDFKDLNIHSALPFKLKVIDINKLKLKYSRFQERRNLLKEFELFLCDQKIYMLLKKLLGKPFYVSKKYPVPLKLDYTKPEEIKKEIISHVEKCTVFTMVHGPNYSVKIGRAVSEPEEIFGNVKEGVSQTLTHILKWGVDFEEVKTISLKGTNTVDLPIFNQLSKEEINAFLEAEK